MRANRKHVAAYMNFVKDAIKPEYTLDCGISNITAEDYHKDPAPQPSLSSSIAKILLEQSPRHAWLAHPRLNTNYVAEEDSRFDLGTAAHAMLLERDGSRIVWVDADDWRTKAARELRDSVRAEGKLPLLVKYNPALEAMVGEARRTIEASELGDILDTGMPEQTILWKEGDVYCRARLDLISSDRKVICDYKTTENARAEVFIRQIARLGYDLQAEFYVRALQAENCGDTELRHASTAPVFVFLAQEITAPFACSLVGLSNAYREIGQSKVARALNLWRYCLSRNEWPGYEPVIHYAEPSAWQLAELGNTEEVT